MIEFFYLFIPAFLGVGLVYLTQLLAGGIVSFAKRMTGRDDSDTE